MGFDTYWIDNDSIPKDFDWSNCLFITEGQVDQEIPIRKDCWYVIHNCEFRRYAEILRIDSERILTLQVYTHDCLQHHKDFQQFGTPYELYNKASKILYQPWATDLLPHEIVKVPTIKENTFQWVGTYGEGLFGNKPEIDEFVRAAKEDGKKFKIHSHISDSANKMFVRSSILSPAIQGKWQLEKGYIPCRIFKNISYGRLGITNSKTVNELFDDSLVFDDNCYELYKKGIIQGEPKDMLDYQMEEVRQKHTYINRINNILQCFGLRD